MKSSMQQLNFWWGGGWMQAMELNGELIEL